MTEVEFTPKGITAYSEMDTLVIRRRWYHWSYWAQSMVLILWYAFFMHLIFSNYKSNTNIDWYLMLIAFGIIFIYQNLAGYFNRTEIRLSEGNIRIQHGPLPWFGNILLQTEGICQIISAENTEGQFKLNFFYDIIIRFNNGRSEKLLTGIIQYDQARFIEQQLGAYYGVEDEHLTGKIGIL